MIAPQTNKLTFRTIAPIDYQPMNTDLEKKSRIQFGIGKMVALVLLIGACSSHFLPFKDPFVPMQRSERKPATKKDLRTDAQIDDEISNLWSKLESKLDDTQKSQLNPPATEQEIARLENLIGSPLPRDFRAFLKIHNGGGEFYSVDVMIDVHMDNMRMIEFPASVDTQLTQNSWHPGLVMFARQSRAIRIGSGCIVKIRPPATKVTAKLAPRFFPGIAGRPTVAVPHEQSFTELLRSLIGVRDTKTSLKSSPNKK